MRNEAMYRDLREACMYLESMFDDCPVPDVMLMVAAHVLIQDVANECHSGKREKMDSESAKQLAEVRTRYAIAVAMHDSKQ